MTRFDEDLLVYYTLRIKSKTFTLYCGEFLFLDKDTMFGERWREANL